MDSTELVLLVVVERGPGEVWRDGDWREPKTIRKNKYRTRKRKTNLTIIRH